MSLSCEFPEYKAEWYYYNTDIKTEKEMYIRMVKGETFYYKGCTVLFKNGQFSVFSGEQILPAMENYKHRFKDFMVEQSFKDTLSNPNYNPLCWVSDIKVNVRINIILRIVSFNYETKHYIDAHGTPWEHATPVKIDELDKQQQRKTL